MRSARGRSCPPGPARENRAVAADNGPTVAILLLEASNRPIWLIGHRIAPSSSPVPWQLRRILGFAHTRRNRSTVGKAAGPAARILDPSPNATNGTYVPRGRNDLGSAGSAADRVRLRHHHAPHRCSSRASSRTNPRTRCTTTSKCGPGSCRAKPERCAYSCVTCSGCRRASRTRFARRSAPRSGSRWGAVLTSCIHTHAGPSTIAGRDRLGLGDPEGYRGSWSRCVAAARRRRSGPPRVGARRPVALPTACRQPPRPAVRADLRGASTSSAPTARASARSPTSRSTGCARAGVPRGVERLGRSFRAASNAARAAPRCCSRARSAT